MSLFHASRPSTAQGRLETLQRQAREASRALQVGVLEGWTAGDPSSQSLPEAIADRAYAQKVAAEATLASRIRRQEERWRARERPRSSLAPGAGTTVDQERVQAEVREQTREFHRQQRWRLTPDALASKHEVHTPVMQIIDSHLPAAVFRLTADERAIKELAEPNAQLQRTIEHTYSHQHTPHNNTSSAITSEPTPEVGMLTAREKMPLHIDEQKESDFRDHIRAPSLPRSPRPMSASVLLQARPSHRAGSHSRATSAAIPAFQLQRPLSAAAASGSSSAGAVASLASKLDALTSSRVSSRAPSRGGVGTMPPSRSSSRKSLLSQHSRQSSNYSRASVGVAPPVVVPTLQTDGEIPLHLLETMKDPAGEGEWLEMLGFAGIRAVHKLLLQYARMLEARDLEREDGSAVAKASEWSAYLEHLTKQEVASLTRAFLSAVALTLQEYQAESAASEARMNSLLALDALANRERALQTLRRNVRADTQTGRFAAHVFKHLHRLMHVPGPQPSAEQMRVTLNALAPPPSSGTSSRAASRPMSAAVSRPESEAARITEGRHGRMVQRQWKENVVLSVSRRPISAPFARRRHARTNSNTKGAVIISNSTSASSFYDNADHHSLYGLDSLESESVFGGGGHSRTPSALTKPMHSRGSSSGVVRRPMSAIVRPASSTAPSPPPPPSALAAPLALDAPVANQAISALMAAPTISTRDAARLLHELNTLSGAPKDATAHPSHLSLAEWNAANLDDNPYARETRPAALAVAKRLALNREAEGQELEQQRAQLTGHVAHVAHALTSRQEALKVFDSTLALEAARTKEVLAVERAQHRLIFERLDEEFAEMLERDEWTVRRTRVEEELMALQFPSNLLDTVDLRAADDVDSTADALPLSRSTASSRPTSAPMAASRPTSAFLRPVVGSDDAASSSLRGLPYTREASTAPDVFPSFRDCTFHLKPPQLPHFASPAIAYQHFAELPITLRPAQCAFTIADLRPVSHDRMPLPRGMHEEALMDEYFDLSTATLGVGSGEASADATTSAAGLASELSVKIPRLVIDFELLVRIAQNKLKEEQTQKQKLVPATPLEDGIVKASKPRKDEAKNSPGLSSPVASPRSAHATTSMLSPLSPATDFASIAAEFVSRRSKARATEEVVWRRTPRNGPRYLDNDGDDESEASEAPKLQTPPRQPPPPPPVKQPANNVEHVVSSEDAAYLNHSLHAPFISRASSLQRRSSYKNGAAGEDSEGENSDTMSTPSTERSEAGDAAIVGGGDRAAVDAKEPVISLVDLVADYHNRMHADLGRWSYDSDDDGAEGDWSYEKDSPERLHRRPPNDAQQQQFRKRQRQRQRDARNAASAMYTTEHARRHVSRLTVEQAAEIKETLQARLIALWQRLALTSRDMLGMLDKYAREDAAPRLVAALPLWEGVAEIWLEFRTSTEELVQNSVQAIHTQRTLTGVKCHAAGGEDQHGELVSLAVELAQACRKLFLAHDDAILVQGEPILQRVLETIDWSCCAEARQARRAIQRIDEQIAAGIRLMPEDDTPAVYSHPDVASLIASNEPDCLPPPDDAASNGVLGVFSSGYAPTSSLASGGGTDAFRVARPPSAGGLHPRPVIPGQFMTLIRGASIFSLPTHDVRPEENAAAQAPPASTRLDAEQPGHAKAPSTKRPRTAPRAPPPSAAAAQKASPATFAALASASQRANNKQWNLF